MNYRKKTNVREIEDRMQIREAEIFGFGKFKERKLLFYPGINVIYGANEAGKSTLHAFLLAMLFGMEKGRGRVSAADSYQRYEPWHSPAYYSGALRFEVGGRPFYLERNFYHREKRDFLRNEADGEELSVAYGDLTMLLGGIHKEVFGNTYDIPQSGAATGKELADSLAAYLSDAAGSGDAGFRVNRAIGALQEKRKKLNAELKKVQSEKEQRVTELEIESGLLQRDCLKLKEDIIAAEQKQTRNYETDSEIGEFAEKSKVSTGTENIDVVQARRRGMVFIVLAVCLAVSAVAAFFATGAQISQHMGLLRIFAAVCMLAALGFAFAGGTAIRKAGLEIMRHSHESAEIQKINDTERDNEKRKPNQAEQMRTLLRESLDEKETQIYNIAEQLEQLKKPTEDELEVQQEMDAVQLAADELTRLAKEFCEETGDALNSEVSRYVSMITGGRYDSVRVDENGKLWVVIDGKEIPPESLSRGTMEQFYLALRLAVGGYVTGEETLPIFLDDAFVLYDDIRLEQTLRVLSGMNRQILLFTCQKREAELLSGMGISYHRIDL